MDIVYIGNKLSRWGFTPTSIETLGERFDEIARVHKYSDKKNVAKRFFHMLFGIWKHRKEADLVVIDTYSNFAFNYTLMSAICCQVLRLPYVPILRGGSLFQLLNERPKAAQIVFGKAFRLVAPSNFLYGIFKNAGFNHLKIIPNYIDIHNYPFEKREHIQPKILWVRSFHKLYNPNLAVDILVGFKAKYPQATLCMVGPDKDGSMEVFRQYAEVKGVLNAIEVTGKLDKKAWVARAATFDIFLNTTNFDNTPVSVMEAMALGMVVVSTNAGGVPAIVDDGKDGLLFPCGDATLGIQALEQAMNPDFAEMLSLNARKRAESWDWQVVKQQWVDLFQEIKEHNQLHQA